MLTMEPIAILFDYDDSFKTPRNVDQEAKTIAHLFESLSIPGNLCPKCKALSLTFRLIIHSCKYYLILTQKQRLQLYLFADNQFLQIQIIYGHLPRTNVLSSKRDD